MTPDLPLDQPRRSLLSAVVRGSLAIGLFQGAIKGLGFIEKIVLGGVYGTDSPPYAAYVLAFEVFLVGTEVLKLSAVPSLVPVLEGISPGRGRGGRERLTARFAAILVLLFLAVVTLPALVGGGPILRATFAREWLADPSRAGYVPLIAAFFRIFQTGILFFAAGVCTYALLNSYRRFGLPALGDFAFKVLGLASFLVVAFVLGMREKGIHGLVWGIFAGCIGYVGVHLAGLWRMGRLRKDGASGFGVQSPPTAVGGKWGSGLGVQTSGSPAIRKKGSGTLPSRSPTPFSAAIRDPRSEIVQVLLLFAPLVVSVLVFNSRRLFDKLLAAQMELADYVAAQDFAFRFIETPYRFLIEPVAIVLLPYLSGLALGPDGAAFRRTAWTALRALLLIFVPASVAFYVLRVPVIQVLLERGRFDAASTYLTCGALRWYILGLTLWGLDVILQRLYFAARDTRRPTAFELAAIALYLALALAWRGTLRHEGLALAFTLSRVVKVGLLLAFIRGKLGGLDGRRNLVFLGKLAVGGVAMAIPTLGVARVFASPREVQVRMDPEGERFIFARPDGSLITGAALAADGSDTAAVRLAPGLSGRLAFIVPETGTYRLWAWVWAAPGAGAVLQLSLTGHHHRVEVPVIKDWGALEGPVALAAGLHELTLRAGGGTAEVDALVLANLGTDRDRPPARAADPQAARNGRGVVALGPAGQRLRQLTAIALGSAVGLALYLLVLKLLRVDELTTAWALLRRRNGKRGRGP